ncbi:phosphate transporter [Emericellopsis atlantica]|uniref:Phosphate transporter n=1 Tax=Emericellopsis atlantica TaxID=2614577 RepID=A0A9P7ZRC5_9HYPO|nr:phosphate transporter [Emericellopsis atlantica]KAG9256691.1 phosphate transporter [Emericellopsis atlantica]
MLDGVTWIIGLISIALCASAFGNGANDVANAYATSVAAQTLTLAQVGILAVFTEFIGAVALGSRVTDTIKSGIIDIDHFRASPSVLVLAMGCAEVGNATWLLIASKLGFPVSTTQTVVGALVGAGIASQASVNWEWTKGSVSQVAASWGIAPCLAAAFSAILFSTMKFTILERPDSFKKALRAIPFYFAFTAGVLALFFVIEIPISPGIEGEDALSPGVVVGIVLGVFFGVLAISYIFFVPYFKARIERHDHRLRIYHVILGPLLLRDNPPLFWPAKDHKPLKDYYLSTHVTNTDNDSDQGVRKEAPADNDATGLQGTGSEDAPGTQSKTINDAEAGGAPSSAVSSKEPKIPEPEDRWLKPYQHLPIYNTTRLGYMVKYFFLQGVSRDCVSHANTQLAHVHSRAKRYDNRVEFLWRYAQVVSAIIMSIAHGSNDVANALGPWVGAYNTWKTERVDDEADTPIWIIVVAGFLLGAGFWFFGFHIIRSLGNKITQMSPVRGFAAELGAAITVLLASSLGLPVSTTQCVTGAVIGVALMNLDFSAINWRQLGFIFCGWVLTLPSAGLISGLLLLMALNAPSF